MRLIKQPTIKQVIVIKVMCPTCQKNGDYQVLSPGTETIMCLNCARDIRIATQTEVVVVEN
jgi:hypothetical protein